MATPTAPKTTCYIYESIIPMLHLGKFIFTVSHGCPYLVRDLYTLFKLVNPRGQPPDFYVFPTLLIKVHNQEALRDDIKISGKFPIFTM